MTIMIGIMNGTIGRIVFTGGLKCYPTNGDQDRGKRYQRMKYRFELRPLNYPLQGMVRAGALQYQITGPNKRALISQLRDILDFPFAEQLVKGIEVNYLSDNEATCHIWGWQEKIQQYLPLNNSPT